MNYRTDTETINDLRTELCTAYKRLEQVKDEKWAAYFHAGLTFIVATALAIMAFATVQSVNSWAPLSAKARVQGEQFCEALAQEQDAEHER